MRPADRLFQIIQILRRTPKPITAGALAAELETSKRTVYRDIADLVGQRVPIRGEAGVGYVLQPGLDLPPLMLTPDEIEAAVLGAQWVARHGDAELARAETVLRAWPECRFAIGVHPHHAQAFAANPRAAADKVASSLDALPAAQAKRVRGAAARSRQFWRSQRRQVGPISVTTGAFRSSPRA